MYVQYLMYTICNVQNNTHHQSVCGILLCVFVYCKRLLNTCDSNIQITSVTVPADQLPGYNNIIIPIISHHTLSQLTGSYSPLIVSISLWRSSPNSPLTATCFSPHILPPRMGTQTYWHTLHQQGVCLRGLVCKPVEGVCVCVFEGGGCRDRGSGWVNPPFIQLLTVATCVLWWAISISMLATLSMLSTFH